MNISLKQLCLLICSCLVFFNCNHQEELTSEESRIQHEELREIQRKTNYQNDREAWLDLSYHLDQLIPKITNDHEYVLNFYHHGGYSYRLIRLYRESLNKYKEFFNYYNNNESKFGDKIKEEFRKKRSFDYRGAALAYERLGYIDSAYFEHLKNLDLVEISDGIWKPAAHNDFGLFLVGSMKDTLLALEEFKKAYKITSERFPEHDLIGSIRSNIGRIYANQNMLDEAYDLFSSNYIFYKDNVTVSYQYGHYLLKSATESLMTLRMQNKLEPLNAFFNNVNEFYNTSLKTADIDPNLKLEYLNIKMQYLLAHKDFTGSYKILDAIKTLSDSINLSDSNLKDKLQSKMNDLALYSIKSNHRLEKKQKEAVLLNQRLIIWIISILSFAFLGVLGFLVYLRKQQIVHAKNKQQIAEQDQELTSIRNQQLNSEIESKKRDLSDFAINLTQNQEWANILAVKLEQLKTTKGRARKKLMDDFENEVLKKTTFDTNTKEFFERLDKLSDSFYSHLNSEFPDLSKTEKRLCSLIRLKIESRNIATMQNISLGSLNTSRYRLRKKLNLIKDDDLDDFIQSL